MGAGVAGREKIAARAMMIQTATNMKMARITTAAATAEVISDVLRCLLR